MTACPQRPSRLACFLSALLLSSAAALRRTREAAENATRRKAADHAVVGSRQQLSNVNDTEYFGTITIGQQTVQSVLDTGSFELVVFSRRCSTCGNASRYDEAASASYVKGSLTQMQTYGSGVCWTADGFDTVAEAGGLVAEHQAMWLASECQMPVVEQGRFGAIVGIGPPGEPEHTARSALQELMETLRTMKALGRQVPREIWGSIARAKKALEAAKERPSLLESFGVRTFSTCLGKAPGSPGWLIWNDQTREGTPGVLQIQVAGKLTWGVGVQGMTLGEGRPIVACEQGCGGIVDTGTSLFAVPKGMFDSIARAVDDFIRTQLPPEAPRNCTDLSYFPKLTMSVGGQRLSFPPSSYVGTYTGVADAEVSQFLRTSSSIARSGCQLLMFDLGEDQVTSLGPMILIGMPLFREYYTTFDLGGGPGDRSLFVSKANPSCQPEEAGLVSSYSDRNAHAFKPRTVDVSKLRVPRGSGRLQGRF